MAPRGRVFVVGSANMDLVVRAPRLPTPGDTVIGDDLLRAAGGKGANQAVAAARLGASVRFAGCVGDDAFGNELRVALETDGIDLAHLRVVSDRPTGVALIVVDSGGENLIAVSPGANLALTSKHVHDALSDLRAADVVLAQLEVPLEVVATACRRGREVGAQVVLNAAPADVGIREYLGAATTLIVNRGEATALSGAREPDVAVRVLRELGPSVVVLTLGGDGLLIGTDVGVEQVAALPVEVVDTTAAGDAFAGAYAVALVEGAAVIRAAGFANVAAGLATTRLGAQPSLPWRAEVDSVLVKQGGHSEWDGSTAK